MPTFRVLEQKINILQEIKRRVVEVGLARLAAVIAACGAAQPRPPDRFAPRSNRPVAPLVPDHATTVPRAQGPGQRSNVPWYPFRTGVMRQRNDGSVSLIREAYQSVQPVVARKNRSLFTQNDDYAELLPETANPK